MGCDIHMVVEKRHPELGWVGLHNFPYATAEVVGQKPGETKSDFLVGRLYWTPRQRNYDLFAEIAGVRGKGPEPRGIPDDASALARMEIEGWGGDGHSHTWLSLTEAIRPFGIAMLGDVEWAKLMADKVKGAPNWETVDKVLDRFGLGMNDDESTDDYRLIIWFDN